MDVIQQSLEALATVFWVGLALGAGLPALYALGMRALGIGRTVSPDGQRYTGAPTRLGQTIALVCFGVTVAAVIFGIVVIIYGKQMFG